MRNTNSVLDELKRVPLFSACSHDELSLIVSQTTSIYFAAGSTIVAEGKPGREFLIVVDGRATVTVGRRQVATLGPGDFFGEVSLLDGGPRTATVTADTDLIADVSSEREFRHLLEEAPHLTQRMLVGLARRLREADLMLSV